MAFQAKTVKFTSPTSTGNQATTGIGFQPKAILFFATYQTAEGSAVNWNQCVGMATAASQAAIASQTLDNVNPFNSDRGQNNALSIYLMDSSAANLIIASLVSLDADGFTLNFTTVQASAYNLYALCLGGSDLTGVFLKEFQAPAAVGTGSVTGVGFRPDCLIMMSMGTATSNTTGTFQIPTFGFATRDSHS
mgnify:CR=1 FL=1